MRESDIRRRTLKDGSYQIWCRKGLWKVWAPNRLMAEREARHYWFQYDADGEYTEPAAAIPLPEA
jgi:hypothetical protein